TLSEFDRHFLDGGKLRPTCRIVKNFDGINATKHKVKTLVANFNSFILRHIVTHRVVGVDGEMEIASDGLHVRGKYDLLTQAADKNVHLCMWKTGKLSREQDVLNSRLDIATTWMHHTFQGTDCCAYLVYLSDNEKYLPKSYSANDEYNQ